MSRRVAHKLTVKKHNPFGTGRMWWATCSCKTWFQGWHDKADAQESAAGHEKKTKGDA